MYIFVGATITGEYLVIYVLIRKWMTHLILSPVESDQKNKNSCRWTQGVTSSVESTLQTPDSGDLLSSQVKEVSGTSSTAASDISDSDVYQ
jgi:hypothetical protein